MSNLDQKATAIFAGKVVRKDLVRKIKVGANVPVFVLEYLLGKYCATDDPIAIEAGLQVVNMTLAENFVRPDESNKAQSFVREKGGHTLIDKLKVRYLSEDDKYWAEFVNFGHKYVHIPENYIRQYDRLLMGGIWAQVKIRHEYDDEAKGKRSPFWIDTLQPIQLGSFDLDDYKRCRRQLNTDEWIDLLVRSIGLEPAHFDRRLKLLFLARLIPLCEQNYNLIELGPRGTGKSYAYQELSPYVILLTGPTTVANLFYNMASGKWGSWVFGMRWPLTKLQTSRKCPRKSLLRLRPIANQAPLRGGKRLSREWHPLAFSEIRTSRWRLWSDLPISLFHCPI
jgi:ATP-dependent Lon protease